MHLQRLNWDIGETRSSQEARAFLSEHAAGEMDSDVSCLARRRGEQIIPWNKVMDLGEICLHEVFLLRRPHRKSHKWEQTKSLVYRLSVELSFAPIVRDDALS